MRKIALTILLIALVCSCSTGRKVQALRSGSYSPKLALSKEAKLPTSPVEGPRLGGDTLKVIDDDGSELLLMKAIKDEQGEMVASDYIPAVTVTAKFRNVAERHGKVDLRFDVIVPHEMADSRWQVRLFPKLYVLKDTSDLEGIYITGEQYRRSQLRGYERYQRFLDSIVSDTTLFIRKGDLEIFLKRNLPEIYALRTDSTYVSEDDYASMFGVTEQEAIEHYVDKFAIIRNRHRMGRKDKMFHKYVKAPMVTGGVRLDTVFRDDNGDFVYNYVQTITARPKLRKAEVRLGGDILEEGTSLYTIPLSDPLTFYISSVSALVDDTPKYRMTVLERKVMANSSCYIEFPVGRAEIIEDLGHNRREMGRIKSNIMDILQNNKFDLDSISISAFASPEGTIASNNELSHRRAASAGEFFSEYTSRMRDSLKRSEGLFYTLGADDYRSIEGVVTVPFKSRSGGENWGMLDRLVKADSLLSEDQKQKYLAHTDIRDLDKREEAMKGDSYYTYLRESVYPKLRIVKFDFHLHRKGMVKDTVHTTVVDSLYMAGVQAIRDRDYENAIKALATYHDYNAAVAYVALDRNNSAMEILSALEPNAKINYLKSIVYSRWGKDQEAVQCYLDACRADGSFVHRGNLDPEISTLINKYGLNNQDAM